MTDLYNIIANILHEEDIEGLIALGAPDDEYDDEAAQIAEAISKLDVAVRTQNNIAAIIALAWARSFDHSPEAIKLRSAAFTHAAERISAIE